MKRLNLFLSAVLLLLGTAVGAVQKDTLRILAIGNSFSQDATHYLAGLAAADGTVMRVYNLYIGGCSLERHWTNIENDAADYPLEIDGASTERYVSVREALALEDWDVIVTQQASHDSGLPETYHPYLENMLAWLRERAPKAPQREVSS